jgi:LysR family hydrogen peroxide-inducible transcriptional activator
MELQPLRYACAVYRERHFLRAAERVHISQPTLSQQIKKLERELGAALFERSPHGVSLTPEGERFLPRAEAVLQALEEAVSELRRGAKEIAGRIRLAAIPTVGPYLLPRVAKRLRTAAPRLQVELHDLTTSLLLEHLKQGRIDMGILALPVDDPGLVSRSFGRERFLLAVSRRHPLAGRRSVSRKDVRHERMLILQEGHCFRNQTLSYCKLSDQDPQIIFQGSNLTSVMRLAAAGEGVTLVPEMAAEPGQHPSLRFLRFAPPEPRREIGVVWRVTTPLNRGHQLLMDLAEEVFRSVREEGPGGDA